jgi:serine/threonine protein kinase
MSYRKYLTDSELILRDYEIYKGTNYSESKLDENLTIFKACLKHNISQQYYIRREIFEKSGANIARFEGLMKAFHSYIVFAQNIFLEEAGDYLVSFIIEPAPCPETPELLSILLREGKLTLGQRRSYFKTLSETVERLHSFGVAHLELAPQNILVQDSSRIYVRAFPITLYKRSDIYWYSSPEELAGNIYLFQNFSSDIFAMGCICAEMFISLTPLFQAVGRAEKLMKMFDILGQPEYEDVEEYLTWDTYSELCSQTDREPIIHKLCDALSPDDKNLLISMLTFNPRARPSAREIASYPWEVYPRTADRKPEAVKVDNTHKFQINANEVLAGPYEYSEDPQFIQSDYSSLQSSVPKHGDTFDEEGLQVDTQGMSLISEAGSPVHPSAPNQRYSRPHSSCKEAEQQTSFHKKYKTRGVDACIGTDDSHSYVKTQDKRVQTPSKESYDYRSTPSQDHRHYVRGYDSRTLSSTDKFSPPVHVQRNYHTSYDTHYSNPPDRTAAAFDLHPIEVPNDSSSLYAYTPKPPIHEIRKTSLDTIDRPAPDNTLIVSIFSLKNLAYYKYNHSDTPITFLTFHINLENRGCQEVGFSTPIRASENMKINFSYEFQISSYEFKKRYRSEPILIYVYQHNEGHHTRQNETLIGVCEVYMGLLFSSFSGECEPSVNGWYLINSPNSSTNIGQLLMEVKTRYSINQERVGLFSYPKISSEASNIREIPERDKSIPNKESSSDILKSISSSN